MVMRQRGVPLLKLLFVVLLPCFCSCKLVYRTRITDEFAWRDVEYDDETGQTIFVGEQFHGLDLEDGIWWCGMNYDKKGSGLLEFLMDHSSDSRAKQLAAARALGHKLPSWMDGDDYPTAVLQPAASVLAYANTEAPKSNKPPGLYSTTRPNTTDYVEIDAAPLVWLLLRDPDTDLIYLGVGGDGISAQLDGLVPPGDGTDDRDNGVRVHISFRSELILSDKDKKELQKRFITKETALYDENSEAYPFDPTEHSPDL